MKNRKYPIPLAEIARDLGVSRQRVWAKIRQDEGKCTHCGKVREGYAVFCNACQAKHRELRRIQRGVKRPTDPYGPRKTKDTA